MRTLQKSGYVTHSADILFHTLQLLKKPLPMFCSLLLFSDPLIRNILLGFLLKILWKLCRYIEAFHISNNCWNKVAFFDITSVINNQV